MRRAHRLTFLFVVSSLVLSCASGSPSDTAARPSSSRSVISSEELAALPGQLSCSDAVRRLRSTWLRTRGAASARGNLQVQVYMDNVRVGGIDFLQSRSLDGITEIRYFNGRDATTRWGTGVGGGVIELITRR